MLQQHKKQHKNGGFTLVELIVVLAITAILAALVGGGLMAYARMARFEKNEANARTLFQAAQISLTRMDTAGELDAFCDSVGATDNVGGHFTENVTIKDADGNEVRTRTAAELNQSIYALYYDKTGATADNQNALVEQLLSDYIYDESLLNAAICVEIDRESGQVYSVFYDTSADKLRFGDVDGAVNIMDRSYTHRRNDSLVGYYSSEDRVNVVELQQTQLKVKNPRLSNGETLTLSWGSNSRLNDFDTVYTATAYAKDDTEKTKPLFQITIERNGSANTTGSEDKQVITPLDTIIYSYDADGNQTASEPQKISYPLSYSKGNFVLTLDAMMDAYQLRTSENAEPEESAYQDLYSITRLLNQPQDFYIVISAAPRAEFADSYTASKDETTNVENTLLASGSTADKGELQYFRHLYNLRWADDWTHTDTAATTKYTYTLTPQANNSNGLNWTGGGVTVYCTVGNREHPEAKTPTLSDPVAWPTIRQLSQKTVLTCETTNIANEPKVPILNLQINNKSVAKEGIGNRDELRDHYAGLVGLSLGEISNITLRDVDMQVNVTAADDTTAVGDDSLLLLDGTVLTAVEQDDADYRDIRAAGALCGASNGTIENCTLERGTNTNTSATVRAAIYFDDTTIVTDPVFKTTEANGKTYRYIENELHGIGGLVGVAMPAATAKLDKLTVSADVSVAGLLVDADAKEITEAYSTLEKAEETRYDQAAIDPNDETEGKNTLWRAVGVGGVIGSLDATNLPIEQGDFVNGASVVGSGFTGGIVGNLYSTKADTRVILNDLKNTGTVCAGASYKGDRTGEAHSRVLGQFFGGIVGYSRNVELLECTSKTRGDLTETQLKNQVAAGYDSDGSLTDASPLRGDFVGGLVGFGKNIELDNCTTEKGYALGNRFVGGLVGGFTGSTMDTGSTNTSYVFGNRYVGGIVSVNGSGSQISNMVNTGLVAGLGKNAAYVGGIVGRNDAEWGAKGATNTTATIINGVNRMASDNATNEQNVLLLQALSQHGTLTEYAKSVGGIVGYNGVNGVVTWNDADCTDLSAILYGDGFVGGIAGYNDEKATISNTSNSTLTVSGRIVAAGDAIGGMIGMNCAPEIPAVEVKATRVSRVNTSWAALSAQTCRWAALRSWAAHCRPAAPAALLRTASRAASSATTACSQPCPRSASPTRKCCPPLAATVCSRRARVKAAQKPSPLRALKTS